MSETSVKDAKLTIDRDGDYVLLGLPEVQVQMRLSALDAYDLGIFLVNASGALG